MNKWDLLSLLREHSENSENLEQKYISGEEISKRFGVSRSAVWKVINDLKKFGYEIDSKTNNGYKIITSEDSDILNEYEILCRLKKKNLCYDVIYKKSTDSTNNDAKKYLNANKSNNLFIAEEQTAGKGRRGRSFYSENNGGVYFTIKINQNNNIDTDIYIDINDITFFPLMAALAVNKAVSSLCGIDLAVKWPNDLLYKSGQNYKKLCGILTEASIEAETRNISYIIIGIGININNGINDFPDYIKNTASSLKIITNKKYNRADIICETVDCFTKLISISREELIDEYKKRLLLGVNISFAQNGRLLKGIAKDINSNGNLITTLENGEDIIIQSGEINFI